MVTCPFHPVSNTHVVLLHTALQTNREILWKVNSQTTRVSSGQKPRGFKFYPQLWAQIQNTVVLRAHLAFETETHTSDLLRVGFYMTEKHCVQAVPEVNLSQ